MLAHRAKGPDSPFSAYLQMLPARFEGMPIFFSAEAMSVLRQYPPVFVQANKRCRFLLSFSQEQLARPEVAAQVFGGQTIDSGSFGRSTRSGHQDILQHVSLSTCIV